MIANLQAHYGFSRMPFGRELAPGMLHRHDAHNQATARITWCIQQRALGVVTGEVGAGKTVALRAAVDGLDPSRHVLIYLPNPSVGVRGIHHTVVAALGGVPRTHHATGHQIRRGSIRSFRTAHERERHIGAFLQEPFNYTAPDPARCASNEGRYPFSRHRVPCVTLRDC